MTRSTDDDRTFTRRPDVEEAPLQGELMLFDPTGSRFFVLNRTMAYIWKRCDGSQSRAAILKGMCQEFRGADPESIEADLASALSELVNLGLLVDLQPTGT